MKPNEKPAATGGQPPKPNAEPIPNITELVSERTMNGLAILFPGVPAEQLLERVDALMGENQQLRLRAAASSRDERDCPEVTLVGPGVLRMPSGQRVTIGQVQCYEPRGATAIALRVDGHQELVELGSTATAEQRDAMLEKLDEVFGPVRTL